MATTGCGKVFLEKENRSPQASVQNATELIPSVKEERTSPDINHIMNTIRSFSPYKRTIGTQGEKEASEYLKRKLESYGYLTQIQNFSYKLGNEFVKTAKDDIFWNVDVAKGKEDGISQNVIAIKKPDENVNKAVIVISAHYDDVGNGGVIDNATGVAVLLEISRVTVNLKFPYELRFLLFGGEEVGLKGSRYYVSKLPEEEKINIIADINLDYIGEEGPNNLIMATIDGKRNKAADLFEYFLENEELEIVKAPASDYISFARAGIPSVSLGQLEVPYVINMEGLNGKALEDAVAKFQADFNSIKRVNQDKLKRAAEIVFKVLGDYK